MVSRNNSWLRVARMRDKRQRFAVKRLSIGVVSVFVGSIFALSSQQAQAAEIAAETPADSTAEVSDLATPGDSENTEVTDGEDGSSAVNDVEPEAEEATEDAHSTDVSANSDTQAPVKEIKDVEVEKAGKAATPKRTVTYDTDKQPVEDKQADEVVIGNEQLQAVIDTHFPRVKEYTYKGDYFQGAVNEFNVIAVNDALVTPEVEFEQIDEKTAHYKMSILDEAKNINASLTVELAVDKNALKFKVIELQNHNDVVPGETIDDTSKLLEIIAFPDYLISISNEEEGAHFDGAKMSVNTHQSGDHHFDINGQISNNDLGGYMYGFLTNGNTSAGVWTNSQFGIDYTRLTVAQQDANVGILASPYYYQR
ncbi:MAG: YSIRK-type signal peptide-containing protein, partial [Aerococcus sp.]|nr:YSIRK-type signal peptide-containing protein [Aerococcus sp.]